MSVTNSATLPPGEHGDGFSGCLLCLAFLVSAFLTQILTLGGDFGFQAAHRLFMVVGMPWDRWDRRMIFQSSAKQEGTAVPLPRHLLALWVQFYSGEKLKNWVFHLWVQSMTQVRSPEPQDFFLSKLAKMHTGMNICNTVCLYASFKVYHQCAPIFAKGCENSICLTEICNIFHGHSSITELRESVGWNSLQFTGFLIPLTLQLHRIFPRERDLPAVLC